jgi:hypothetical protein
MVEFLLRRFRFVSVAAVLASLSCRSAPTAKEFSQLHMGMTPAEVSAQIGTPSIDESFQKDGVATEYWSYLLAHYAFRRWSTYECLTFKDGRLTEWVTDNGTGGHSAHLAQAAAKKP